MSSAELHIWETLGNTKVCHRSFTVIILFQHYNNNSHTSLQYLRQNSNFPPARYSYGIRDRHAVTLVAHGINNTYQIFYHARGYRCTTIIITTTTSYCQCSLLNDRCITFTARNNIDQRSRSGNPSRRLRPTDRHRTPHVNPSRIPGYGAVWRVDRETIVIPVSPQDVSAAQHVRRHAVFGLLAVLRYRGLVLRPEDFRIRVQRVHRRGSLQGVHRQGVQWFRDAPRPANIVHRRRALVSTPRSVS